MIELPYQDPCEFCEGMAGRATWAVVDDEVLHETARRIRACIRDRAS